MATTVTPWLLFWWLGGFLGFTFAVAVGTYFIVRKLAKGKDEAEDFFSGGNALTWPYIFGSLMLTNLSTETLVGLNGLCWRDGNLGAMAWESTACIALILTASVFLPRFYSKGFVTTPALLEAAFGVPIRTAVSILFLGMYATILLPANVYSAAVAIHTMFTLEDTGVSILHINISITIIGSLYALGGGMKTIAVSDTLNGVGLLVGGVAVSCLSYGRWGASLWDHRERFGALAPDTNDMHPFFSETVESSMPWHAVFSGTLFIQIFYWSTNQVIVQRALCAKTFAHGQKGLLLAAVFKLLGPAMLCFVGILALGADWSELDVAADLTDAEIEKRIDRVYPAVVRLTLPRESLGIFAGILLGSALSSFNSALAASSTLFALELYPNLCPSRTLTPNEQVIVGRCFGVAVAVLASVAAEMIVQMPAFEGIFSFVRKFKHVFAMPILALFLLAITSQRLSQAGAWGALLVGVASYVIWVVVAAVPGPHWVHKYLICLALAYVTHEVIANRDQKASTRIVQEVNAKVAQPWPGTKVVSLALLLLLVFLYVALAFPHGLFIVMVLSAWCVLLLFFCIERRTEPCSDTNGVEDGFSA